MNRCDCGAELPAMSINACAWVVDDTEPKFGGRYERRDFCSVECADAAPQHAAPKRPRQPRQRYVYGDLGQLAVWSGQVTR
jgi:hypothetical protein